MATHHKRRTVITGVGVVSPLGHDPNAFWTALDEGRSSVKPLKFTDVTGFETRIGSEIHDFVPRTIITDRNQQKALNRMMSRTVQMGLAASHLAYADAGFTPANVDPTRIGVEFGCGMIATEPNDVARAARVSLNCSPGVVSLPLWGTAGLKEIEPLWMLKYLPNMPACHATINLDLQGPSNTITSGEAASLLSLAEAVRIIRRGAADAMLAGGAESKTNPLNFVRNHLFLPLSRRNDAPEKAHRPFDKNRDGMVVCEGAAVFAVEDLGHATKRGAKIYAEVAGYACGFDRARDGKVTATVLRRALADAGVTPGDIDHVNAHGLATPDSDVWEANAIAAVFGRDVPVWAPKGNFGAAGCAASLFELLGSVMALKHGRVPATLNCDDPDPACRIRVHAAGSKPVGKPYALKLNFTDLGQVGACVVRAWGE